MRDKEHMQSNPYSYSEDELAEAGIFETKEKNKNKDKCIK